MNKATDNEERKIDIATEPNDVATKTQGRKISTDQVNQKNVKLQEVKIEKNVKLEVNEGNKPPLKNVNPLFYEIGPFPRKAQRLWVQYIGPQPEGYGGYPLEYEPSRNGFVLLVFGLVLTMLLCTAGFVYFCHVSTPVKNLYSQPNVAKMLMMTACGVTIALSYAFACSGCTRTAPCSYICLSIAVFAYGIICSYFTLRYETGAIFVSLLATCAVVLVCLALACSRFDFTSCLLILIVAMTAFFAASLLAYAYMAITGEYIKQLHIIFLVVGTVLNSILLVVELQMILGGRSVQLSEDDYAYAAFSVYTSIVTLFLNILQLMNMDEF